MNKIETLNKDTMFVDIYKKVRSYARMLCRNQAMAEDLTQETMLRAYTHFDKYDTRASFDSWVLTIARNQYVDLIRKANRRVKLVSPDSLSEPTYIESCPEPSHNPEQQFLATELEPGLAQAIAQLAERDRQLLLWIAVEEVSVPEAAERLQSTPGRIRRQYRKLLRAVRNFMKIAQQPEQGFSAVQST